MTPAECDQIIRERFSEWAVCLRHHHCTPALLVGVGHDQSSGELHVLAPEDLFSDDAIEALLIQVLALVRWQRTTRK